MMQAKNLKFPQGTFLEVDDLEGGRKVVMVGKDGVTVWDSIHTEKVTPIAIHPVMHPVSLGSAVEFVGAKKLSVCAERVLEWLRSHMDKRANDALFIMRALWVMSKYATGEGWAPNDSTMQSAFKAAQAQEDMAFRHHQQVAQGCALVAAEAA